MTDTPDISTHQSDVDRTPVKKYFNYEGFDRDDDFDFITGWAQESGIKSPENLQIELRKIEQRLGSTNIGEDRIIRIKNYLKSQARLNDVWKEIISQESHGK